MRCVYGMFLVLLFSVVASSYAAKPRLKAKSSYQRYIIPDIQPYHAIDSTNYTYSGSRGGDSETNIFFDSQENISWNSGTISSHTLTRCTYRKDTITSSTTSFQYVNGDWVPSEKNWYEFNSNDVPTVWHRDSWSGTEFTPFERTTMMKTKVRDTTVTERLVSGVWTPLNRNIVVYDTLGRQTLQTYSTFDQNRWTEIGQYEFIYKPDGDIIYTGHQGQGSTAFRQYYDSATGNTTTVIESLSGSVLYDSTAMVYSTTRDSLRVLRYQGMSASVNKLYSLVETKYDSQKRTTAHYEYWIPGFDDTAIPSTCTAYEYNTPYKQYTRMSSYRWVDDHYRIDYYSTYSLDGEGRFIGRKNYQVDTLSAKETLTSEDVVKRNSYGQRMEEYELYPIQDSMVESSHYYYYYEDVIPSGVEEVVAENDLRIFPNPASWLLTVENNKNEIILSAEVYTSDGRKADCPIQQQLGSLTINTSALLSGVYIVHMKTTVGNKTLSFVKD